MKTLIEKLPKAELHLHIEGSLEPELMFELAKRNEIALKFKSIEEVRKAYDFSDLQTFLDIYYEGAKVLIKEQDFYDLTWAYLTKMHQENTKHVEIFFDPQTHTDRGIAFSTVIKGIDRALTKAHSKLGITSRLILCFLRHLSEEAAFETLKQAKAYQERIIAVGLDSSEVGHPPKKFENVFEAARKQGYLTVAHAGEEGPANYIWEALDLLKISRVDHGVRCEEDPKLVKRLIEEKIALTVCPLSNVKLKVYPQLKDHNLKRLLDQGICITINSDDPSYFGGYLNQNYIETQAALELSRSDIITLAKNSFQASFLPDEEKQKWIKEIDKISKQE